MRETLMAVVVLALAGLFMAVGVMAGSLDSPAAPTSSNSAMFTLEDIYNKLNTRTNVSKRTGAFTEPAGGPTSGAMHTLNDIMTLATNRAPVAKTWQTNVWLAGDDATYQKGVAWPNPRFTGGTGTNGTNCVTDNFTGLIWARNANLSGGMMAWTSAVSYCTNLTFGGYSDWRLPNLRELRSLINVRYQGYALCNTAGTGQLVSGVQNNPFNNLQSSYGYWTSTADVQNPGYAWCVYMYYGYLGTFTNAGIPSITNFVWPVRGGGD